jgi:hypothetical protein
MESSKKKDPTRPFLLSSPSLLSKNSGNRAGALSKRLKLYTDEEHQANSLSIETLTNRIINLSKDYLWRSYDILYYLPIVSSSLKSNFDKKNLETFLYFFYSVSQTTGYGVVVQVKGNDIEFKQSWNLMEIKNVKFGHEINEFILTVDEPLSYRALSSIDRDEIVWILIQICQYLCDHTIKSKSFETKHLIAAIAAKETFTKFPLLKRLLEENMDDDLIDPFSSTGESILSFTPEESDAEKLFDELQWGNASSTGTAVTAAAPVSEGNSDPAILQKKLKTESELLHIEICDFLLQWEDDDLIDHSIAMGELKSQQERIRSPASAAATETAVAMSGGRSSSRETLEMLTILAQVDQELMVVDDWLTKQINYLSSVQRELFQIEAENSTLETSWHNLSAVKTMITALLDGPLSLAPDHEVDLRNPVLIVRTALEDKELKNTQSILLRLVNALVSLRNGLLLIEGNDPSFNPSQWERLQSMSVIAHQRNKLIELSDLVCNSLTDLVGNLFKTLLQHKALTDQSVPKNRSIVVRKFSFSTVTNRVKEQQGRFLVANEEEEAVPHSPPPELGIASSGSTSVAYGTLTNQLLNAQQVYHTAILPFVPLLENLAALSPTLSQLLCSSYVEATEAFLYCPLTKEMFRELINSIPSRPHPVFTLASAPKSLAKRMTNPTLRFQHPSMCRSGTPLVVSPWTVLAISIKLIEEVAAQEKAFLLTQVLKKLNTAKKSSNAAQDYLASTMGRLFEQFREKILRLVTQTEYSEGVEIIPMLITTDMLFGNHHHSSHAPSSTVSSPGSGLGPAGFSSKSLKDDDTPPTPAGECSAYEVDLVGSLLGACKSILQDRLNEFVSQQIAWINQCKEDPKKSIILLPFAKFPAFVDQIKELAGDKVPPFSALSTH